MFAVTVIALAMMCAGCTSWSGASSGAPESTAAAAGPTPTATYAVTALLVESMDTAQIVRGSDGANHVEYNLRLDNGFSGPVTLTSVTVVDPDGHDLMKVDGARLAAATQSLFAGTSSAVIAASAAAVVEVDLVLPTGKPVPAHVSNQIDYTLPAGPNAVIVERTQVDGITVRVDRTSAVQIAPPLTGNGWLATSACCSPNLHRDLRLPVNGRRVATPETFAVDWAKVKGDRVYDGSGNTNQEFYGFGASVLAVADGTVVSAVDGIAESTPFEPKAAESKESFGGNAVILKIDDGVYAFYAHLQTGSVTVHVGDEVKTGDVIGKLGNTGPSTGAHLHFGLLDSLDIVTGTSLPFVLTKATLTGTVDFAAITGDTLVIAPESRILRKAYPLYATIVDFE
ncbi:M23 family metallopeptidase [Rathayibacter soli]|uniref:M23 family metallopeptidase n=1 Tax=Rathayibacter soli TaxID=3144168 RepID=UPI0027E4DD67|nr:M23 family metallopeptidase [Glaciibacter superstes]